MIKKTCSIGIMAFNEAENIVYLVQDLLKQETDKFFIMEIIVVVSGCIDGTRNIIMQIAKENKKIKPLFQETRQGKASAINLFFKEAKGDFIVLVSADTRLRKDAVEKVLIPLLDSRVGMTGGMPSPVNEPENFMGYGVQLLWRLHHQMSLKKPKLGELIAFRNCIKELPIETAADEATLEAIFTAQGLSLRYVPEAVVYNRGAKTVREFILQRERIFIGHLWVKKNYNYSVASLDYGLLFNLLIGNIDLRKKHFFWILGIIFLEIAARFKGAFNFFILKKNPYIWKIHPETKGRIEHYA